MPNPLLSETEKKENDQVYIVNLSSIHQLVPLSDVLDNFATLHYQYASSWLGKWYSKLWVSLHYLKLIPSIKDYKLGAKDTQIFIEKLQEIFYFIPTDTDKKPEELLTLAWNSLIAWNSDSMNRFSYLLALNKPVFLISNTNPLNIEKIKSIMASAQNETWQWQTHKKEFCQFQTHDNINLVTSYENKVFKKEGLIKKLVKQLLIEGKTHKDINLVSQYRVDLANGLNIKNTPADQFFAPDLKANLRVSPVSLNNPIRVAGASTPIPIQTNNLFTMSRQQVLFKSDTEYEENSTDSPSEKTPLLSCK